MSTIAAARLANEVLRVLEEKLGPRSAQAEAIGECVPIAVDRGRP